MHLGKALLALNLLGCCHWAAAQQDRYRVAGTVVMSQGRSMAMIVRAPGDTITVAAGDALDDGRVVEVGDRYVRVSFPGRDLLLPLSGGAAEVVPTGTLSRQPIPGREASPSSQDDPYMRHLPGKQLLFAVDALSSRLEREGFADGNPADAGRTLTRLLGGLIGFPDGAVIRDINGQSFSSVAQGLDMVENLLERDQLEPLRFLLTEASGPRPLYVFPE